MTRRILTITALAFLLSVIVCAQQATSPQMAAAADLMKQQKFVEAAAMYEKVVSADPQNGPGWYQLAAARYALREYAGAAAAYQKNIAISDSPFAIYNLACVYALMGEKDKALEQLAKAVAHPKMVPAFINFADPDLVSISTDPRFATLRLQVDRKVRPCMYSEEAKQFNFWVGEWDVYNPQGRHDGTSRIESFANGCGILENWMGTIGGDGKSINFYDSATHKWYQYWMGGGGSPGRYSGVYRDGAIRYEGETPGPNGTLNRLTFFNVDNNTVRQLAESSSDGGKTWQVGYDYKYVRRKPTGK